MSHLRGLAKLCAQVAAGSSLVWALSGCADSSQPTNAVAAQTAALEAGGAGGGSMMPPDELIGHFTQDLAGLSLTYRYTHDGDYFITYGTDTVTFRLPLPDGTHSPPITVPYEVRALRAGLYMIHWVNPERTVHVTQLLDLPKREVNVAALMPGQWQLFDVGHISAMSREQPPH